MLRFYSKFFFKPRIIIFSVPQIYSFFLFSNLTYPPGYFPVRPLRNAPQQISSHLEYRKHAQAGESRRPKKQIAETGAFAPPYVLSRKLSMISPQQHTFIYGFSPVNAAQKKLSRKSSPRLSMDSLLSRRPEPVCLHHALRFF